VIFTAASALCGAVVSRWQLDPDGGSANGPCPSIPEASHSTAYSSGLHVSAHVIGPASPEDDEHELFDGPGHCDGSLTRHSTVQPFTPVQTVLVRAAKQRLGDPSVW